MNDLVGLIDVFPYKGRAQDGMPIYDVLPRPNKSFVIKTAVYREGILLERNSRALQAECLK
jgi:hypothetical protein